MKHFVVKDAMALPPGLATDAENAWWNFRAGRRRRGAVPMRANINKTMRQSIPIHVLKAQEDF